jgi:hypothetical protein
LNFDVRYDVNEEMIVTGKIFKFHVEQMHPCVSICQEGKCDQPLCNMKGKDFKSTADAFDPWDYLKHPDPIIGKLAKITQYGTKYFMDQDGGANNLDLNWRRLRNLAWPIVDCQLAKLAITGDWKTNKVRLHLGTLMIDNNMVQIGNKSYTDMNKEKPGNDVADMKACNKSWNKKLVSIIMKQHIEKEREGNFPKRRKTQMATYLDSHEDDDNKEVNEVNDNKPKAIGNTTETTEGGEKKEGTQLVVQEGLTEDGGETNPECEYCSEYPCVWEAKKEDMRIFDMCENGYLPVEDYPPNNIRHKKLYREMFLHINQGPSGSGVRMQLPGCVEIGARLMFPLPTCMGFKDM